MSALIEVEEDIAIDTRGAKIDELVNKLMAGEKHLSFSSLKAFSESPQDFIQYCLREKKTTDAMIFGSLVHCLVLEPAKFDERYCVMNDSEKCREIGGKVPRNTNAYREWKSDFISQNEGKIIIDGDTFLQADIISSNVKNNRASARVLHMCPAREVAVEWEYKNLKFHGFIDGDGNAAMFDLKTCQDASPRKFQQDIIKNKYFLQAPMYLTAKGRIVPYYIIAADKKGGVSVHKLHSSLIEYGMKEYERLLDCFNDCIIKERFGQSYDFWSELETGAFVCEKPSYLY